MKGYWFRNRLLPTIIMVLVLASISILLFVFPVIEKKASSYNEQSIYKNSFIDFIAPEPSFEQVDILPGTEGIETVFPFYLTKTTVEVNGVARTTTVLLSDQFENVDSTMYSSRRLIESSNKIADNSVYVDWQFCKDTSAEIGDVITFSLNGSKEQFVIQAIYETNSLYDGGAILVKINPKQKSFIKENSYSNGYSAIYITASDYTACKNYMAKDYRPLGRLQDRNQFKSDEQYKVHYDAIMSSGYANEITDFRVRENSYKSQPNELLIILGSLFTLIAIIIFNRIMAARGCEKGYFAKYCIPKGMNIKPYYFISFIFEILFFMILYTGILFLRMKLSTDYIPNFVIDVEIAFIPISALIAEIITFYMNNSRVVAITKNYRNKKSQKKVESKENPSSALEGKITEEKQAEVKKDETKRN